MNEREIFEAALDLSDPAARQRFLDQACGQDADLRSRIEALLTADEKAKSFLAGSPFPQNSPTSEAPQLAKVGSWVGPYKLLQQVGEGGMGLVFMAEQSVPVRRRVAVKIIKPGMDTKQVLARFDAERQALAMMDHPNIARVLDVGATVDGHPYFVMELVNGTPITQYADEHHLDARERLELFIPVCEAIQHAHHKGIIHRDLKPSNILIALYDGRPVPKVIDFGIAKAVDQRLTERTLFTALGQVVGTLEYMSPEQATRNQLDIDTRSDVYSLGVVLYELLTGETPLDRQRLRTAAWDEILRMIREEEPLHASARLSSSERLPSIAANRRTEPAKLSALLRGELDWIVAKSLEKDRTRRYESASQLASDVRSYLRGDNLIASPPSSLYRFRKFIVRHWRSVATLSLLFVLLLLGIVGTSWQARRAILSEEKVKESLDAEKKARAVANDAQRESEKNKVKAQNSLLSAKRRMSQLLTERGLAQIDAAPHAGLPWLIEALKADEEDASAQAMQRMRMSLTLRDLPKLIDFWPGATKAQFSKDGKKLAMVSDNELLLLDLHELKLLSIPHPESIENHSFTELGDRIATVTGGQNSPPLLRIWNAVTGKAENEVLDLSEKEYQMRDIPKIQFTPDGKRFIATYAGMANRWHSKVVLRVFDSHSLTQIGKTFAHHSELDYQYHIISPDCSRVLLPRGLLAGETKTDWVDPGSFPESSNKVQQYELTTSKPVHAPLPDDFDFYTSLQYNPDGSSIVTSDNGFVKVWNAHDGTLTRQFALIPGTSHAPLWFHPDGKSLVIIEKLKATWFDVATGATKADWTHEDKFAIDSLGKQIAFKDTNGLHYLAQMTGDQNAPQKPLSSFDRAYFSKSGNRLLLETYPQHSTQVYSTIEQRIYDTDSLETLAPPWRFEGGFSPSGRYWLCQKDEGVWLWDLESRTRIAQPFPASREAPLADAAINHDRTKLVVLTEKGHVSGWHTDSSQMFLKPFFLPPPKTHQVEGRWTSLVLSPDAAFAAFTGQVRVPKPENQYVEYTIIQAWNLEKNTAAFEPLVFSDEEGGYLSHPRFLPADHALLIPESFSEASQRRQKGEASEGFLLLHFFDLRTGARKKQLKISDDADLVEISRDGKKGLVACSDSDSAAPYLRMINLENGQSISPPMTPKSGGISNARLSADASQVIMGNCELWDALRGAPLKEAMVSHRDVEQFLLDENVNTLLAITDSQIAGRTLATEFRLFSLEGELLAPPILNSHSDLDTFALQPNGQKPDARVLAALGDQVRLWDITRALPLSSRIELFPSQEGEWPNRERSLFYSSDGKRLFMERSHDLYVIELGALLASTPSDEVLNAWSQILSAQRIDESGGVIPLKASEFESAWRLIQKASKAN
jgi:serine/threonine protein kinase